ncbi:c-type cytochrome [Uliginosibacterium sp. 31-16]|uniref:c-type cytochrome n=1 Tax=Uliginosibacterium sp. 31-16 TaxID=3068315 RepID=UPI00273DBF6E|nr:c-type cytochrome [Uliginosibacterium sp. 31-16]MDP5240115.1 c-type cytochrome [Uliginosibacterium sp. 31-16]
MKTRFSLSRLLLASALICCASNSLAANPAEGRAVFENLCSDCHTVSVGKNKRGPALAGVVGRKAASGPNYRYSDAMAGSNITWTPERLAQYLASPKTDIPGTKMRLLGKPNPAELADLIAWLQQAQ